MPTIPLAVQRFLSQIREGTFAWRDIQGIDLWEIWSPARGGWTDVGAPAEQGRFRVVGRQCFFQVLVTPDTSVETTTGASYIELPIQPAGWAGVVTASDITAPITAGIGVIQVQTSRAYMPSIGPTSNPVGIAGWYEV